MRATGKNLIAIGPDSPMIGVYSLDIFTERVSKIIHSHAAIIEESSPSRRATEDSESEPDHQSADVSGLVAPPLFLYIAWQNCHDPYDVPQKYVLHPLVNCFSVDKSRSSGREGICV